MRWMKRLASAALMALSGVGVASATPTINVPLAARQIAPSDVTPVPMPAGEIYTAMIPFALADSVDASAPALGMTGASLCQFKVEAVVPADTFASLVKVTFLPNGLTGPIVATGATSGGTNLASTSGDTIVVQTGLAAFKINKTKFNVINHAQYLNSVVVNRHSTTGGVYMKVGATLYCSVYDDSSATSIEENGPVSTTILSTGQLKSAGGVRIADYTCRLRFDYRRSHVRATVTMRNARHSSLLSRTFTSWGISIPGLNLTAARTASFGIDSGILTDTLAVAEKAYLYQGKTNYHYDSGTAIILPVLTADLGLACTIGTTSKATLGDPADFSEGWMKVVSGPLSVMAGMRDMASFFPTSLSVSHDTLQVDCISPYNSKTSLVTSWGAHDTRELLFDFAGSLNSASLFEARLVNPVICLPSFDYLRLKGTFRSDTRVPTIAEEAAIWSALGQTWPTTGTSSTNWYYRDQDIKHTRRYSFSSTGGPNQIDHDECDLIDFVRGGYGGRFEQARLGVTFKADQAVTHSDDWDYDDYYLGGSKPTYDFSLPAANGAYNGKGAGSTFEDEHPHWPSMLLYWRLTGDPRVRDAITDYLQWRGYRAGNPSYGYWQGGGITHVRAQARAFRDAAMGYPFLASISDTTATARCLTPLKLMARNFIGTVADTDSMAPSTYAFGRDLLRGYWYATSADWADSYEDSVYCADHSLHLFFMNEIQPDATWQAMKTFQSIADCDTLAAQLNDFLLGQAHFMLEAQVKSTNPGYPYEYPLAVVPDSTPTINKRGDDTSYLLMHGFEATGDSTFIQRAADLAWRVWTYNSYDWRRNSSPPMLARIYDLVKVDSIGVVTIDAHVTVSADSTVSLGWVEPAGVIEYLPPKIIVEAGTFVTDYGFNPLTRAYTNTGPPTNYAYWAVPFDSLSPFMAPPAKGVVGQLRSYSMTLPEAASTNVDVRLKARVNYAHRGTLFYEAIGITKPPDELEP